MKVSVWVVNFESSDHIVRLVQTLDAPVIDRIVVLNNSGFGHEQRVLEDLAKDDRRLRVLTADENLGFGGGMNFIGRAEQRFDTADRAIWLLNPDTLLLDGDPSLLVRALQRHADIVSPLILCGDPANSRVWFAGGKIDLRVGRISHCSYGTPSSSVVEPRRTVFMTGAAPMLTRATWDELGGFDERLFLYWEDVDLSLRATAMNKRMVVDPSVSIWHAEGGSDTGAAREVYRFHMARNRIWVSVKYGSRRFFATGALETLKELARACRVDPGSRRRAFTAALRGTIQGFAGARRYRQASARAWASAAGPRGRSDQ